MFQQHDANYLINNGLCLTHIFIYLFIQYILSISKWKILRNSLAKCSAFYWNFAITIDKVNRILLRYIIIMTICKSDESNFFFGKLNFIGVLLR